MAGRDTIVAVATAPGRGGIGIVRLSGPDALAIGEVIADRRLETRHAHHTVFRGEQGEPLDDGIAIAFRAPASFTGEDVVELQGHGGPAVLSRVVARCRSLGARMARPGEFSERAFLNDRLDLAQAEAIADLIDAASEEGARAAMRSLQGEFSDRVHGLMNAITALRVFVEAAIDFPDEEVDFLADGDVAGRIAGLDESMGEVLAAARVGARVTEGMTVVLAGPPNAGKSSLLNALARRDAAIVTDVPGTTRDVLTERIELHGMPLHVIDTAGLRLTEDPVEAEGVRRARNEIARADALLYVMDVNAEQELEATLPADRDALRERLGVPVPREAILILNKIDAAGPRRLWPMGSLPALELSARTGDGLDDLVAALEAMAGYSAGEASMFTARTRHVAALEEGARALADAAVTLTDTGAGDLVAEDLRRAHDALGTIVGTVTPDDLLGEIFSTFCIGK